MAISPRSRTFVEKMGKGEWVSTREMLKEVMRDTTWEQEWSLLLSGGLRSTHYWQYDAGRRTFWHTRDIHFTEYRVEDILRQYEGALWKRDN